MSQLNPCRYSRRRRRKNWSAALLRVRESSAEHCATTMPVPPHNSVVIRRRVARLLFQIKKRSWTNSPPSALTYTFINRERVLQFSVLMRGALPRTAHDCPHLVAGRILVYFRRRRRTDCSPILDRNLGLLPEKLTIKHGRLGSRYLMNENAPRQTCSRVLFSIVRADWSLLSPAEELLTEICR